jgi:hypothetical protein
MKLLVYMRDVLLVCLYIAIPPIARAVHEWRWRRRKRRHGGDLLEQLEKYTHERRYIG